MKAKFISFVVLVLFASTFLYAQTPSPPVATAATGVGNLQFTANWNYVWNANSYRLDVSTVSNFSTFVSGYNNLYVGGTSITLYSNIMPATTYYYRVRAVNSSGTSVNSNVSSVTTNPITVPNAPVATAASSISTNSFLANWNAVQGATHYFIDVSTVSNFATFVPGFNNTNTNTLTGYPSGTVVISLGITPYTTYYYRIRAANGYGSGQNSNVITVTTNPNTAPPAPVANAATNVTSSTIQANWTPSYSASGYRFDVSTSSDFSTFVSPYNNANVTSYTSDYNSWVVFYNNINPGTTYYYRIRAVNSAGTSPNSNTITVTTMPIAPTLTVSEISPTTFTLNWSPVATAIDYDVDISLSPSFSPFTTETVTGTSLTKTGLPSGVTHYVRVRTRGAQGYSGNASKTIQLQSVPVATAATNIGETSFTANVTPNGAISPTALFLDVSTDPAFSTFVGSYSNYASSSSAVSVTGLTASTVYYYRFRQELSSGRSANSNVISQIILPSPVVSASDINLTGFKLTWPPVPAATEYEIDFSVSAVFSPFTTETTSGTSFSRTGLPSGVTHYARVRAKNSLGASQNTSKTIQLQAPPTAISPTGISYNYFTARCTPNNWETVALYLDVSLSPTFDTFVGSYNNYYSGTASSVQVTGLPSGTTFYYRFRQVLASGMSANSNTITVATTYCATPPTPNPISLDSKSYTFFKVTWPTITEATGYRVDVSTDDTFTAILPAYDNYSAPATANTGLNITGLTHNTTYYLRIRSVNFCGNLSSYSTTFSTELPLCITPATPVSNPATNVTAVSYTASWSNVSAPNGYNVYTNYSGGTVTNGTSGTSLTVTGLHPSTNYTYWVVAKSDCANSGNSVSRSFTTAALGIPVKNQVLPDEDEIYFSWYAVDGATEYQIQWSHYDDFPSSNGFTASRTVTGLSTRIEIEWCSIYYFRVRARCAAGDYSGWRNLPAWPGGAGCRTASPDTDEVAKEIVSPKTQPSVYPNAVERQLNVVLPEAMKKSEGTSFRVVDLVGREFQITFNKNTKDEFEADVAGLQKGMYILFVETKESKYQVRFLKK